MNIIEVITKLHKINVIIEKYIYNQMEFESKMNQIQVLTGWKEKDMRNMATWITDLSKQLPESQQQIASNIYDNIAIRGNYADELQSLLYYSKITGISFPDQKPDRKVHKENNQGPKAL